MLINQLLNQCQFKRLEIANKLHKFGALQTWAELFVYQVTCKDLEQIKQIGEFARRTRKEKITLPLKDFKEVIK